MHARTPATTRTTLSARRLLLAGGLALGVAFTSGCSLDSYLDQSKVGRWEKTPASVPVLERIAAIEGTTDEFVEFDEVRPEDLTSEAAEYRVSAGDQLEVRIWDIITTGQVEVYPLLVDTRGTITIPQLGEISVETLTPEQVRGAIADRAGQFVRSPLVQVTVVQSLTQTFTLLGSVPRPGAYYIPTADYRLLEAITAGGGIAETAEFVLVIRQVPLEPTTPAAPPAMAPDAGSGQDGENLIDIIDNLTDEDAPADENPGGSPGAFSTGEPRPQPEQPAVDLVEEEPGSVQATPQVVSDSAWIFLNGQWVRAARTSSSPSGSGNSFDSLVTQRVIRVAVKPLLNGDARFNIVVRPGDVVRVPSPELGYVYMGGEVARSGAYGLPEVGRLTLMRAIQSAGGLSPTAIPERCDLTRVVGLNRQATITLNLRAMYEGTQPDIYLKRDDLVNIGTNFWAYPLAVFRNGFRATYGFGFLLDRNFGNDVFGPPPVDRGGDFSF